MKRMVLVAALSLISRIGFAAGDLAAGGRLAFNTPSKKIEAKQAIYGQREAKNKFDCSDPEYRELYSAIASGSSSCEDPAE